MVRWWPEPTAGDIVWCHFPDQINPRPKPRPALVLSVFDTKFNLRQLINLPFSTEWFSVPPLAPNGQIPKLGMLHPSMVRVVEAAYVASQDE